MPELSQQQFDLPGYAEQEGVTVAQFMRRASWHGTGNPNWNRDIKEAGVAVHSGTPQAAADRMGYDRLQYPRYAFPIVPKDIRDGPLITDRDANYATGTPDPVQDIGAIEDARRSLYEDGQSVPYVNAHEDVGSTSYVSPPGGFMTLEETTNFDEVPRREAFAQGSDFAKTHAQPWEAAKQEQLFYA